CDQHSRISGSCGNVDFVDNADNRRLRGNFLRKKREASFFAAAPVDALARTSSHRIERHDGLAFVVSVAIDRLDDEQALAVEAFVFHDHDDFPDDTAKNHFLRAAASSASWRESS